MSSSGHGERRAVVRLQVFAGAWGLTLAAAAVAAGLVAACDWIGPGFVDHLPGMITGFVLVYAAMWSGPDIVAQRLRRRQAAAGTRDRRAGWPR
jgi:hypothetical protein